MLRFNFLSNLIHPDSDAGLEHLATTANQSAAKKNTPKFATNEKTIDPTLQSQEEDEEITLNTISFLSL